MSLGVRVFSWIMVPTSSIARLHPLGRLLRRSVDRRIVARSQPLAQCFVGGIRAPSSTVRRRPLAGSIAPSLAAALVVLSRYLSKETAIEVYLHC